MDVLAPLLERSRTATIHPKRTRGLQHHTSLDDPRMHGVRGDPGVTQSLCEHHREHQHEELRRRVRCKSREAPFTLRVIYVLFGETSDKKPMRLVHAQTVGGSLAFLTDERVRDAYSILQADSTEVLAQQT